MSFECTDYPLSDAPHLTHVGTFAGEAMVTFETHTHLGYEVHAFRGARASVALLPDRPAVSVGPGDAVIMPPGIPHRFVMRSTGTEVRWLGFQLGRQIGVAASHMLPPTLVRRVDAGGESGRGVRPGSAAAAGGGAAHRVEYLPADGLLQALSLSDHTLRREPLVHLVGAPEIGSTIDEIISEARSGRMYASTRVTGLIISLVAQLERRVDDPTGLDGGTDALSRAVTYVNAHCSRPVTLAEVASALDLSTGHLSRLFTSRLGLSFGEYVAARRLERAQELLGAGFRVADCAAALGWSSVSGFCRWFGRLEGQSPGGWVRDNRATERTFYPTEPA